MHITDYTKTDALTALSLFIFDAGNDIGTRTMFAKDLGNALLGFIDAGRLSKELKLSEMPVAKQVSPDDTIFLGTGDGNKVVPVRDIFDVINGMANIATRKNVFRGKNIGNTVSDEQHKAITDGSFYDMFVGDYWVINNFIWRIVDFDYYYKSGENNINIEHHLVIAPDLAIGSAKMNDTNITTGAYVNSEFKKTYLTPIKNIIFDAFGEEKVYNFYLVENSGVNSLGVPNASMWIIDNVVLFNEYDLFGSNHWGAKGVGSESGHQYTLDNVQMSLFVQDKSFICLPETGMYWLRDTASASSFAAASSSKNINSDLASHTNGVRPYFLLIR